MSIIPAKTEHFNAKTTADVRQQMIDAYQAGESREVIAARHGLSPQGVWKILRKAGVMKPREKVSKQQRQEVVAAYLAGESSPSIAERLQMTPVAIRNILRKEGVEVRDNIKTDEEQRQKIVEAYTAGKSGDEIAKDYDVTARCIRGTLKREGVEIRDASAAHRVYKLNEHAFDDAFTSEAAAYFVGLLASDGNVSKNRNTVKLSLTASDIWIVEQFRDFLGTDIPIKHEPFKPNKDSMVQKGNPKVTLAVQSPILKTKLIQYGVVPKKSLIMEICPELSSNHHFWRGVIDGDGSITFNKERGLPYLRLIGSKNIARQFCSWIRSIWPTCQADIHPKDANKQDKSWLFEVGGKGAVTAIRLMYEECTISLPRKLERAKKAMAYTFADGYTDSRK